MTLDAEMAAILWGYGLPAGDAPAAILTRVAGPDLAVD